MSGRTRSKWIYVLPVLHLCACLVSVVGYFVSSLQYLGIVWTYIILADFPISLVAFASAWKHGACTAAWILIVGTFWWYLLSRGIEALIRRIQPRQDVPANKPGGF